MWSLSTVPLWSKPASTRSGSASIRGLRKNVNPDAKPRLFNSRYRCGLMIDQECIDNLLAMSQDPCVSLQEDPQRFDRCVKVVCNIEEPDAGRF